MSPLLAMASLYVLACLDGSFAGFRSAAGRNPRLFKSRWYRREMGRGLAYSQLAALVVVGATALLAPDPVLLHQGIEAMLQVYGLYGCAALLALVVYLLPHPDVSSLATVLVLGPLTLLRGPTIVAGALWAAATTATPAAATAAALAAAVMLLAEPVLSLRWRGWDPLPPAEPARVPGSDGRTAPPG